MIHLSFRVGGVINMLWLRCSRFFTIRFWRDLFCIKFFRHKEDIDERVERLEPETYGEYIKDVAAEWRKDIDGELEEGIDGVG